MGDYRQPSRGSTYTDQTCSRHAHHICCCAVVARPQPQPQPSRPRTPHGARRARRLALCSTGLRPNLVPSPPARHSRQVYPLPRQSMEAQEEARVSRRQTLHRLLGLPTDRPLLRVANAVSFDSASGSGEPGCSQRLGGGGVGGAGACAMRGSRFACKRRESYVCGAHRRSSGQGLSAMQSGHSCCCRAGTAALEAALESGGVGGKPRLRDVHVGLPAPPLGGSVHLVQGSYDYFHYMQVGGAPHAPAASRCCSDALASQHPEWPPRSPPCAGGACCEGAILGFIQAVGRNGRGMQFGRQLLMTKPNSKLPTSTTPMNRTNLTTAAGAAPTARCRRCAPGLRGRWVGGWAGRLLADV